MGRGGSSTNSGGDDSNGNILATMIAMGVLMGTAIGVLCNPKGALSRKQRTNSKNPTESHEPAEESPKDAIPCINISNRFATCLQSNGYDINKCIIYYDLLKDCQKN